MPKSVALSPVQRARLLGRLAPRRDKCFLCKWIEQDIRENGGLTGHPFDWSHSSLFPIRGKVWHLRLEGML